MAQPLYIIGSDEKWEEQELTKAAQAAGYDATFLDVTKITISLDTHGADIRYSGESIRDTFQKSKVIFRRTRGARDTMTALALLADHWKVPCTDSTLSVMSNLNKMIFMPSLTTKHIHNIPTAFIDEREHLDYKKMGFTPPILVKPTMGRHGEGVEILEDEAAIDAFLKRDREHMMFQKYLEIEEEFRVFVVGGTALGVIQKIPQEGSKIANYAAGATFRSAEIPEDITNEAIEICTQLHIEIGGVDLARVGSVYYLLEVNRCPEFYAFTTATGIDTAQKIIEFIHNQ